MRLRPRGVEGKDYLFSPPSYATIATSRNICIVSDCRPTYTYLDDSSLMMCRCTATCALRRAFNIMIVPQ
jgi:hypothetical protein